MLVTDKYIFVHYPKTGGTFVSKVLEEYHKREKQNVCRLLIGNTVPNTNETYGQHGGINEVPLGLTNGRLVSVPSETHTICMFLSTNSNGGKNIQ